ncbi:bromodomain adjacent to zinc finger domain protein 1A, partial [Elysia marginata]
ERMKKLEEKRREMELYREWCRPRDDLECDDLKEMPELVPVRTRVPTELFGDAAMILEFAHIFKAIFDFKQFFPKGFTWGMTSSVNKQHRKRGGRRKQHQIETLVGHRPRRHYTQRPPVLPTLIDVRRSQLADQIDLNPTPDTPQRSDKSNHNQRPEYASDLSESSFSRQ